MGELILLIIMIYWLATDTKTALWVIGGVIVLAIIGSLFGGKNGNKKNSTGFSGKPRIRIDHPHLVESSDYECSICGRRFGKNQMSCPYCGVRFTGTKEDFEEFDEEEDEWAAWDEEEGL